MKRECSENLERAKWACRPCLQPVWSPISRDQPKIRCDRPSGTATKYRRLREARILERTRMFGQDGNEQPAENISQASNSTACICYASISVTDLSLRNPFISIARSWSLPNLKYIPNDANLGLYCRFPEALVFKIPSVYSQWRLKILKISKDQLMSIDVYLPPFHLHLYQARGKGDTL